MGGASEAILEDLLRQANITNTHLANLIRLRGGVAAEAAAKSTSGFTKVLGVASVAVGVLSSTLGLVTGVFSSLAGAVTGVISNFYNLAQATAVSGTKLSEFYATFKDLPILGRAFGIFSDVIQYQESLLERFQMITTAGALFGGSLTAMRAAAAKSYMSLDDFAELISKNSEVFATIGNTVDSGVKRFVTIQGKLLDGEYGSMMRGLGYTAKTTGEMLAFMMRTQGLVSKDRLGSDTAIIKRTAEYAAHLSVVSQLTGQRAEELQKKVEDISTDASYEAFLKKVGTEKSDIFRAVMTEIASTGSEDFAKMFKNYAQGINVPMGEMQVALENASQGTAGPLLESIRNAVLSGKSLAEVVAMTRRGLGRVGESTGQFIDRIGITGTALSSLGDPLIKVAQPLQRYNARMGDLNSVTAKTIEAEINAAKAKKGEAERLQKAQESIRNFGNEMMILVSKIIAPLTPYLSSFAKEFAEVAKTIGDVFISIVRDPAFKNAISGIATWFKTSYDTLKGSKTMGELFSNIGLVLIDGLMKVWKGFEPVWTNIIAPTINALFRDLIENIWVYSKDYLFGGPRKQLSEAEGVLARTQELIKNYPGSKDEQGYVGLVGQAARSTSAINQLKARIEQEDANRNAASAARWTAINASTQAMIANLRTPAAAEPGQRRGMSTGTLGTMGSLFADFGKGTDVTLHGKEAVVTPSQMSGIVNNSMASGIETLNIQVAELIRTNKEIADYTRRNVDATRSLSGDLFAT